MARLLFFAQTALSLWMLVDAAKKHKEWYWFLIIMLPFGEIAYLLAVKLPEDKQIRERNARLYELRRPRD